MPDACLVCAANDAVLYLHKDGFDVFRCPNCGFRFVSPTPSAEELEAFYNTEYAVNLDDYAQNTTDARVHELERFMAPGRLFEVGASYGHWLSLARDRGWQVQGSELSVDAAQHAREQFGLKIYTGDLPDASIQDGQHDAVVMWDVIEHTPNPQEQIDRIFRLLRPGGIFGLRTVNGESLSIRLGREWGLWMSPPDHLWFFSSTTLPLFLQQRGFEPIATWTARGDGLTNPYQHILSAVTGRLVSLRRREEAKRQSALGEEGVRLRKAPDAHQGRRPRLLASAAPVTAKLDEITRPLTRWLEANGLGDELVCYARRPLSAK